VVQRTHLPGLQRLSSTPQSSTMLQQDSRHTELFAPRKRMAMIAK
jgi:hypothetical protein